MEEQKNNSMTMGVIAIVIIAALAIGAFVFLKQPAETKQDAAVPTVTVSEAISPSPATEETASSYKDGNYTMVGNYMSPGGEEEIGVTLTLEKGIITKAEVEPKATRPASVKFQGIFAENYQPLVVGKSIAEVQLDKVSGSSLTPKGFNDAIEKIKKEAQS